MTQEVIDLITYYIKKTDIINDLDTNDSSKPLSSAQGKNLQDNKVDKEQLSNYYKKDEVNSLINQVMDEISDTIDVN